jgi:hypothetical protein
LNRRRHAGTADERVAVAWAEASEALSLAGVRRHPSETLAEFRQRMAKPGSGAVAGVEPGTPAGVALHRLADTVASTAYAPAAATSTVAEGAETDRDTVVDAAHGAVGTMRRLLDDLDPRPLIRR